MHRSESTIAPDPAAVLPGPGRNMTTRVRRRPPRHPRRLGVPLCVERGSQALPVVATRALLRTSPRAARLAAAASGYAQICHSPSPPPISFSLPSHGSCRPPYASRPAALGGRGLGPHRAGPIRTAHVLARDRDPASSGLSFAWRECMATLATKLLGCGCFGIREASEYDSRSTIQT